MVNIVKLSLILTDKLFLFALLACLFPRKSRFIVIARLLCNNFNVAHYSKSVKVISTKLEILAHHDKMQLQANGHNSESYSFGVMFLFKLNF